jgi:hypothetical protein
MKPEKLITEFLGCHFKNLDLGAHFKASGWIVGLLDGQPYLRQNTGHVLPSLT